MQKTPDQIFDEIEFRQQEVKARRRTLIKDVLNHGWPVVICFLLLAGHLLFKLLELGLRLGSGGSNSSDFILPELAMVFFAVSTVTFTMERQMRELKERVAKLEAEKREKDPG